VASLHLQVLTPAERLLDVERTAWVRVQLADGGGISIYPGHAPLLAETVAGPLRYADGSSEHTFDVQAGILQINKEGVTIFTSGQTEGINTVTQKPERAEERRFDRLAQELLTRLESQTEEILETYDDER
jgi:F0F1-type ATP synthase epsilon subunit